MLAGLQVAFSSPEALLDMAAPRVIYGQSPYAYMGSSTPATVRSITRDDFPKFRQTYYVPAGACGWFSPALKACLIQSKMVW